MAILVYKQTNIDYFFIQQESDRKFFKSKNYKNILNNNSKNKTTAYKVYNRYKICNTTLEKFGLININNDHQSRMNTPVVWSHDKMDITAPMGTIKEDVDKFFCCRYCGAQEIIKAGKRKTKCGSRQRYKCKNCHRKFVSDPIKGYKATSKFIILSMVLYFEGLSYRSIKNTFAMVFGLEVHHETIRRWINKFMKAINRYIETLEPHLSNKWHIDEQKIKTKKNGWLWSWNAIDHDTRFLIANTITKEKDISNTHHIFEQIKKNTKQKPESITTDGWRSYPKVISNEFNVTEHIKNVSLKDSGNNLIERYHGTWKNRYKTMRGLENEFTAIEMLKNYRTYYNLFRRHQALNGKTPAEIAGINIRSYLKELRF